jgi:leucyl aminopeptidase
MDGELGQTQWLYEPDGCLCERVLLVGCGKERELGDRGYRRATEAAVRALNQSGATEAVSYLSELNVKGRESSWRVRQAVVIGEDALYRFDQLKSEKHEPRRPLKRLKLTVPSRRQIGAGEQAIREGAAIASGVRLAKDLANLPGNICTPDYLADQARTLKRSHRKLKLEVLDEAAMEKLGMGAFLSVSRGSEQPGRLITMQYLAGKKTQKPIVVIGKGITFDTGGISIKPAAAMDEMKFDMGGAASVFGLMRACAELELPINLIGMVAAAENMPSGRASKPGDVVTTMSGQTVEILNTDAEGRLVLCDALTYAERHDPDVVIDVATLTGACIVALGHFPSGLLSNHEPLARELIEAGEDSLDRVWQLPLWEDYQDSLKSNFADMANIGGRSAGAITAACFLSRFAKKLRWAHLDIAGTAWFSGEKKGASGRPVPLLMEYVLKKAPKRGRAT